MYVPKRGQTWLSSKSLALNGELTRTFVRLVHHIMFHKIGRSFGCLLPRSQPYSTSRLIITPLNGEERSRDYSPAARGTSTTI